MVNGIGNLLCMYCKAQMRVAEVQSAATIHKYIFECSECERIRVIEIAPKLHKVDYGVSSSL